MPDRKRAALAWLMAATALATALATGPVAHAATKTTAAQREAALIARLEKLEAEIAQLRGEAVSVKAQTEALASQSQTQSAKAVQVADAASQQAEQASIRLAALEKKPQAEGFRVGATTFKLGGFVKVVGSSTHYDGGEVATGALGREFYLPQQIPVGGRPSNDIMGHARQTRLAFSSSTPLAGREVKSVIEFDFALAAAPAGAQRATNPYVPTFRRGFISYGRWLIGQEWTTFQNPAHLPETTDFVGPMDGSIFARQMMVQYRQPLGKQVDLYLAVENPQTETMTTTSFTTVDNDQDRKPDAIAKLVWKGKLGDIHIAGMARELSVHGGGKGDTALGWGLSTGGRLVFGPKGRHDVKFQATYGHGIGRYFSAGFVPDAVYDTSLRDQLYTIDNLAGYASVKLGWTDKLRSTFMAGYQSASYPQGLVITNSASHKAYSFAGNLFFSPVKALDLGVEYRRATRELLSGAKGNMDRIEMTAKYAF